MYDVINNLYHLIVLLQMETGNVPDWSNNISVSIGLQNVTDRYGTDQKAIRYNGNIVLKKKVVRANHGPYITKTLRKAITKRSYLKKVYFKKKTPDSLKKIKKQKNYCSRLYKKEWKKYFQSLDQRRISGNKSFWKNIQPFFFDDHLVSEELNKFFENATRDLEINENFYNIDTDSNEINSVEKAINNYRNHPSVLLIKSTLKNIPSFSFNEVGLSEIERELNLINPRKATTANGIPPKLPKSTKTICSETLKTIFNNWLIEFPNELKRHPRY